MGIKINLDVMMAQRKIGLVELAGRIDITPANLSILKIIRQRLSGFQPWRLFAKS